MKNHHKMIAKDDLSKARTPKEGSENTGIKKHLKTLSPKALTILVKAAHRELMKKKTMTSSHRSIIQVVSD